MINAYVYILASRPNGVLYTGMTGDLIKRFLSHRAGNGSQFVSAYRIYRLVWFEPHDLIAMAIVREKRLKKWRREWKVALIEKINPEWRDLFMEIAGH